MVNGSLTEFVILSGDGEFIIIIMNTIVTIAGLIAKEMAYT